MNVDQNMLLTVSYPGPEKLFCFLGAASKCWFASGQYVIENHHKYCFKTMEVSFLLYIWSTFLARGTLPGSSAPMFPILFRPCKDIINAFFCCIPLR